MHIDQIENSTTTTPVPVWISAALKQKGGDYLVALRAGDRAGETLAYAWGGTREQALSRAAHMAACLGETE